MHKSIFINLIQLTNQHEIVYGRKFVLTSRLLSNKSLTPASRNLSAVALSALAMRRFSPRDSAMSARSLMKEHYFLSS